MLEHFRVRAAESMQEKTASELQTQASFALRFLPSKSRVLGVGFWVPGVGFDDEVLNAFGRRKQLEFGSLRGSCHLLVDAQPKWIVSVRPPTSRSPNLQTLKRTQNDGNVARLLGVRDLQLT